MPDKCVITMNIRTMKSEDVPLIKSHIDRAVGTVSQMDGIRVESFGEFLSPPKPLDENAQKLLNIIIEAGQLLGLTLPHKPSGGTCDGNKLAAVGLAVIDSMGPRGGNLHSAEEFVYVDSLAERAKLTLLTLARLSKSE